jgi:hypothetical protein
VTPTIDLTIHFRASLASPPGRDPDADPAAPSAHPDAPGPDANAAEHCFARFRSTVVHEGFFEEDGVIWAADGTVLLHSRQLALVMPLDASGHVVR